MSVVACSGDGVDDDDDDDDGDILIQITIHIYIFIYMSTGLFFGVCFVVVVVCFRCLLEVCWTHFRDSGLFSRRGDVVRFSGEIRLRNLAV
jgi:hypothetical protein